jgi:hypothetical protein
MVRQCPVRWSARPAHCRERGTARREALRPVPAEWQTVGRLTARPPEERHPVLRAALRPGVRAGFRREQGWQVRPSAAAGRKARVLRAAEPMAQWLARVQQAPASAARPMAGQGEAVRDEAAGRPPAAAVAALALAARRREAAVVPGAAEGARRRAAPGGAAGRRPVAREVARDVEAEPRPVAQEVARGAEEEPRPEAARAAARDAEAARPRADPGARAVRPSAPALAALPSIRFRAGRLAPSLAAGFARQTAGLRIAWRSARWWPAARGEVLS